MKKIALEFTYSTDIILVPDKIALDLDQYQMAFDRWIYDTSNEHEHWVLCDGEKVAVSFGTETFVDFLNNLCHSTEEKSIILEKNISILPQGIPKLLF